MGTVETHDLVAAFVENCTAPAGEADHAGAVLRVEGGSQAEQLLRVDLRRLLLEGSDRGIKGIIRVSFIEGIFPSF